jgi:hypothetical protein
VKLSKMFMAIAILAVFLTVFVPLFLRCQLDAKYGVVHHNVSELACFAAQWAEKSILAQDQSTSTATLKDYYASLAGVAPGDTPPAPGNACPGEWIATDGSTNSNWAYTDTMASPPTRKAKAILGRYLPEAAGVDTAPDTIVEDAVNQDVIHGMPELRNPFNHVNVFRKANFPADGTVVPGALAFGCFAEPDGHLYFAFAFQGTDSTTTDLNAGAESTTFHAGMGLYTTRAIRNSIFLGRFK